LVLVPVGVDGHVALYNDVGTTHLIADVVGYVPSGGQSPFSITQRHLNTDAESRTEYSRYEYDQSADDAGDPNGGETETVRVGYSESIHDLSGTIETGDKVRQRDTTAPDLGDGPPWVPLGDFDPVSESVIADARASVQGAQADAAVETAFDISETASQLRMDVRVDAAATITASPDTSEDFPNGDELDQDYRADGRAQGKAIIWFDVPVTAEISLTSDCYGPGPSGAEVLLTRRTGQLTTRIWSHETCESLSVLEPGAYSLSVGGAVGVDDDGGSTSTAVSAVVSLTLTVP
jgi:hypothetical protein